MQQVVAVVDGDVIKTVDAEGTVNRPHYRYRHLRDRPEWRGRRALSARSSRCTRRAFDGQDVDLISDSSQDDVDRDGCLLRNLHTDTGNVAA